MPQLSHHCFTHPNREAAGRCIECKKTFCHECTTLYTEKLYCIHCLTSKTKVQSKKSFFLPAFKYGLIGAISFAFITSIFYYTGKLLSFIPSSFHDATIWKPIVETYQHLN